MLVMIILVVILRNGKLVYGEFDCFNLMKHLDNCIGKGEKLCPSKCGNGKNGVDGNSLQRCEAASIANFPIARVTCLKAVLIYNKHFGRSFSHHLEVLGNMVVGENSPYKAFQLWKEEMNCLIEEV